MGGKNLPGRKVDEEAGKKYLALQYKKPITWWRKVSLVSLCYLDADGNGAIDFPEFLALMSKNLDDCDPEDILRESFKVFDRDGSGFIGVAELDRVFKLLGQDFKDYEIEAMVKAADADGDGLVGYDDFMMMMNVWMKGS